jgi:hypothetical protein
VRAGFIWLKIGTGGAEEGYCETFTKDGGLLDKLRNCYILRKMTYLRPAMSLFSHDCADNATAT